MKKAIILIFLIISITSCLSDAEFPESFPIFITNQLTIINTKSIVFSAKVISTGTEKIIDYGFQWEYQTQTLNASVYKENKPDEFSLTIHENFEFAKSKFYRAYIKTEKHTVYSNWAPI